MVSYAINYYIIILGAIYLKKIFDNNLLPNIKISYSKFSYFSNEIAFKWLEHFDQKTRRCCYKRY